MNSFGRNFRIAVFGESHGKALGVVMDGVPAGIPLSTADFEADLARRRDGDNPYVDKNNAGKAHGSAGNARGDHSGESYSRPVGVTPRRESDLPEIVSGLLGDYTTGAPLTVLFRNENTRSGDYAKLANHPRPSHADLVARQKFGGYNDPRGGGHFSGRVTLGLVAAGVVAKKILGLTGGTDTRDGNTRGTDTRSPDNSTSGPDISSQIIEIGGSRDNALFEEIISDAVKARDSVGGIIECRAARLPTGLGEPFFDSVESIASHLLFSIPGVKGVEFGSGFAGAALKGSENNDPIIDSLGTTLTNNAGGIVGGITNGNDIAVRIAVKPTASISRPQQTYNFATDGIETLETGGRHDACIAFRAAVVCESALAIALADLTMTANAAKTATNQTKTNRL